MQYEIHLEVHIVWFYIAANPHYPLGSCSSLPLLGNYLVNHHVTEKSNSITISNHTAISIIQ